MSSRVKDSGTPTTIGGDLTITGNVTSKGEIQLDGHVQGDIHCMALILGESANVEGNVTADDVVIRGRLIGSIRALRVMLQATATSKVISSNRNSLWSKERILRAGRVTRRISSP